MGRKSKQYAESIGYNQIAHASRVLMKDLVYHFYKKHGGGKCYRCGKKLKRDDFTIDHIEPWRNKVNAKELFFNINNISFSHISCNTLAKEPKPLKHGLDKTYRKGCRCNLCKKAHALYRKERRNKKQTIWKERK